jgi:alpha-1,2-mannosyltransferase
MAAAAAWLPLLGMPARGWLDFSAFYAAGALAFSPQVLQLGSIAGFQAQHGLPNTPFLYPPAIAIIYAPLTSLPYDLAAGLHVAVQGLALVAAALLASRIYDLPPTWTLIGAFAWAPAAAAVVSGQNSVVLLLLALIGAWAMGRGPDGKSIGGLAIGIAAYRPHLGLPLTALAIWRREWVVAGFAVMVLLAQYALGVVATGGDMAWPADWLSTIAAETANDFKSVGWQAVGLPGILGRVSLFGSAPGALLGPALLGYLVGAWLVISALRPLRHAEPGRAMALTCALALFAGPRGFTYDGTLLLPAVAVIAREAADRGWPWSFRWLLAAGYGLGLAWPLGEFLAISPLALVVLVAPLALLGRGPFRSLATART